MSGPAEIVLYTTTFASTVKIRSDISKIKHILASKKIHYEEVDLTELPHRRRDMLANSDNNPTLPQLHVNSKFIGTVDEIQEFEDWGELDAILRGVSPSKLAADAEAAFQAATAQAAAAAPVPRFTLEEENQEATDGADEPSAETSEEEIEVDVAAAGQEDEAAAEEPFLEDLDDLEERSLTPSVADTVDQGSVDGEDAAEEAAAAAPTPDRAAPEQSPAQLTHSPISPLSDVDTEVPAGRDPGAPSAAAAEVQQAAPEGDLPTPLRAHRLGEGLHAHPVEGELFPSPEKRPLGEEREESEGAILDGGHLIA